MAKLFWVVFVMLANNLLILPVFSAQTSFTNNDNNNNFGDEKSYYSSPADPHVTPTPSGSHHHSRNPPSSGGSGSYNPPLVPSPSGGCTCSPPPSSGGGGSYYPPTTPSTPLVPSPPFITPITPITPVVPSPSTPIFPISPPTPFDPNTPLPCTYWGSHPALIFGALGWWATLGGVFGVVTLPGLGGPLGGSSTSLQQVLNNPRNDGYGALYREGAASYLNSVATHNFYFSAPQVKDHFISSLSSEKAAARQARLFKLANEGKLKKSN